jgi:hypothetical protein
VVEGGCLKCLSRGNAGFAEFKAGLDPSKVMYGFLAVYGVDERGSTTSRRTKTIAVTYIGENVKIMEKARVSTQKGQVLKNFTSISMELQISEADDLTQREISMKLIQSGGAHKPHFYEFGPDDTFNVSEFSNN